MSADRHPGASRIPAVTATPHACASCRAFAAEVLVPASIASDVIPGGCVQLCWLCAHHVADHGVPVDDAALAACDCLPGQIYPDDVRPDLGWRCEDCGDTKKPAGAIFPTCGACCGKMTTATDRAVVQAKADFADRIWAAECAMRGKVA